MRKFEEVRQECRKFPEVETKLPIRSDTGSCGYDLKSKENKVIAPGESYVFWTDCKIQMFRDNVAMVFARSGLGTKYGVVPRNCVGIIDPSYANNENNDGNIGVCLVNNGKEPYEVHVDDRIAQVVITRFYITDDDESNLTNNQEKGNTRSGGFGSSGK